MKSMYLSKEMAEFVINEFAANNVKYIATHDAELVDGDSLTRIDYEDQDPYVGNFTIWLPLQITFTGGQAVRQRQIILLTQH